MQQAGPFVQPALKDNNRERKQFCILWDMDDTLVAMANLKIKNPQMLLPFLLFQTYAPNQHVGILTSRPPTDDLVDYTVKSFRKDLADFGIDIPEEQTVFCGGENEVPNKKLVDMLQKALEMLPAEFESLSVTEKGASVSRNAEMVQQSLSSLLELKAPGKNHFIIKFLNEHLKKELNAYIFAKGSCAKENLIVGLVDDNKLNANATIELGRAFFGVNLYGGKLPINSSAEVIREYYSVDYFHTLADKIGFTTYCESLLADHANHRQDHPMLQMSALLYLWQTSDNKDIVIKRMKKIEKQMSDLQCEQIAKMLDYIIELKISKQAHYHSVEELVSIFKPKADRHFLNTVTEQFSIIENKIAALSPARVTEEAGAAPLERSKSKLGLGSFFKRTSSTGKSQAASTSMTPEIIAAIREFERQKLALTDRLKGLASSPQEEISTLANQKLKSITMRTNEDFVAPPSAQSSSRIGSSRSASSSNSNSNTTSSTVSASSSGANTPADVVQRRSFTPAADSNANRLRTVASTGSLEDLDQSSSASTPSSTTASSTASNKSKKLGSNLL